MLRYLFWLIYAAGYLAGQRSRDKDLGYYQSMAEKNWRENRP